MTTIDDSTTRDAPRDTLARTLSPLLIVMLLLSIYGLVELIQKEQIAFLTVGTAVVLGCAAIWLVYGAVAVTAVILLQRYARRPAWTVAVAFAWGGLAATYFAALANAALTTIFQNATGSDASVWTAGPLVEETLKAVGVIALALVPVLRRFGPVDGLFYGVVVGAGFQVVENFVYAVSVAGSVPADAQWQSVWTNVFLRGLVGLFTHAVWTGLVGAAIGWVAAGGRQGRALRVLGALGTFVLAVLLHGVSNWAGTHDVLAITFIEPFVSIGLLVAVLLLIQRRERRRLTDLAVDNDGWGVLDTSALTSKEQGRRGRKRRRLELRYAYAQDQYGPDAAATRAAAARLAPQG